MKEGREAPRLGIAAMGFVSFVTVAATGKGEILLCGWTTFAARNNVVYFKGLCGERRRAATIFAQLLRSFCN
jgi:hypothetical protein